MGVLQGLVSNDGYLYAAWKGEPDDDRIFYSFRNGSGKWEAAGQLGGNTSAGPSLGVFNKTVYAAWKGEWSDPRVFYSKYSGSKWDAQQQIPNIYSDTGPALCSQGQELVAVWKNFFDQNLYYATFDGTTWSTQTQISGVASSVGPSLASFNGKLYAAWMGTNSSIEYASFDGSSWSSGTQISAVGTSVGPSLATVGGKLYAVWKGASDQNLWYAFFDGTQWHGQVQISGPGSSMGAAIAEFNGKLYAMWKGEGSDVSLFDADFNGTTWSQPTNHIPGNTGPDTYTLLPAPAEGNFNYLFADSEGAGIAGTTITIIVAEDIVPDNTETYSFQFNCNSPAQPSGSEPFVWQQFGFRIAHPGGSSAWELFFWVNCFRQQDLAPGTAFIDWDSRLMPDNTGVVPLPNNRLPKGWQLTTTLTTDSSNRVNGFAFSVAQPDGTFLNAGPLTLQHLPNYNASVASANLAPILNFQPILVGENAAATTDFSAGQGIFLCYENNNLTASASQDESGENSNVSYLSLPASYPNGEFYQAFGIGLS
jgi:hypothetical protein